MYGKIRVGIRIWSAQVQTNVTQVIKYMSSYYYFTMLPPSGGLTPFNIYVALSRGRGRDNIRLLRNFDEKLLMMHPCEHLRIEDERLARLDMETQKWWYEKMQT